MLSLSQWVIKEDIWFSVGGGRIYNKHTVFLFPWCQATLGWLPACRRGLLCAREAHAWTGTARGISVPLSGHTSHTRRWHWLYIRDSLTSPSVSSLSPLLFFYSTRSSECCLHCGDPDRCGGPRWQVQDREKSERLICSPRRCWLWESWSVTFDMSLIRRGVQQDTGRCKLSPRPAEDALLYRSIRLNSPPGMFVRGGTLAIISSTFGAV